jgi:hypothetical protein
MLLRRACAYPTAAFRTLFTRRQFALLFRRMMAFFTI